jgi:hypothetical protein
VPAVLDELFVPGINFVLYDLLKAIEKENMKELLNFLPYLKLRSSLIKLRSSLISYLTLN